MRDVVETPTGKIVCQKVAITTAAYTGDLWPQLRRSIVPVICYQAATEQIGGLADKILPNDEASSDTRMDLCYFRKDREGRLVSGGSSLAPPGACRRWWKNVCETCFPTCPRSL